MKCDSCGIVILKGEIRKSGFVLCQKCYAGIKRDDRVLEITHREVIR